MNVRILGKTGLKVNELALGGVFVSSGVGNLFEDSKKAVLRALDMGVNYIDTVPMYDDSEEVIGRILQNSDKPVMLSTKLGARPQPFRPRDRDCLLRSVEESLKLLKRDTIDILMIHEPDRPGMFDWWTDMENYQGPVMEVLDQLKKDGVIKYTGLGGTTCHELAQIIDTGKFDVVLTAFNYSLLWREAEIEVLPNAKKHNMGIILASPLQQGALAKRYDDEVRNGARWMSPPRRKQFLALYEFLDEVQMSLPEMGVRFAISNPDISCVLVGARSVEEVEQNVASVEKGPLSEEILRRLNDIAAMVPFRPFEEPVQLPFNRKGYKGPGMMR